MDLRDWNNLFWQIIRARLYKPKARLYLAFDESILNEELSATGCDAAGRGAVALLNETIGLHCQIVDDGFLGLSRQPNGPFSRNDWEWVFEADDQGLSLALTFAVQQILAAEQMLGVSYYTAYWRMLGAIADETRINPFGDGGRNSFRRLWRCLRTELVEYLGVDPEEITFKFGRGSNKYRNLPVSQALLSEADLREARATIGYVGTISDEALYSALRAVKLSPSGQRKVFIAPLKDAIIRQIRVHEEDASTARETAIAPAKNRADQRLDPKLLVLFEDHELFGDTIYQITSRNSEYAANQLLSQLIESRRYLVFEPFQSYFVGTLNPVLHSVGAETFILARSDSVQKLLVSVLVDGSSLRFDRYFSRVETSLGEDFVLLRCPALPTELEGLDLSSNPLKRRASTHGDVLGITFFGGICVNRASNSYVVGFGPEGIHRNGTEVDFGSVCELDGESTTLGAALIRISQGTVPRKYMLFFAGKELFINMDVGANTILQPSFALTTTCLIPIALRAGSNSECNSTLVDACEVNASPWPGRRDGLFRRLQAELSRHQVRWVKSDSGDQEDALSLLSYLQIPSGRARTIAEVVSSTCVIPFPLFRAVKNRTG